MPVADTELLFLLNPADPRFKAALSTLEKLKGKLYVPDTALLEFEITLKSKGRSNRKVKTALLALKEIFEIYGVIEAQTLNIQTLIRHLEIMYEHGLSFFDSLIASSTLSLDGIVVSDDKDFDKVVDIRRIPITQ